MRKKGKMVSRTNLKEMVIEYVDNCALRLLENDDEKESSLDRKCYNQFLTTEH